MTGCARAAVAYARLGWPVVPLHGWDGKRCTCLDAECPSPAKHPRTRHGLKDASTDPATIGGWWKRWPASNVGLLTGVKFDVLDVDGEEGDLALGEVARGAGDPEMVTTGPMASTGKGWHLLFLPTGEGNRARLVDHVDWRGTAGYIVAPPSLHATGRRYRWLPGCGPGAPLEAAPGWLLDLVAGRLRRRPGPYRSERALGATAARPLSRSWDGLRWPRWAPEMTRSTGRRSRWDSSSAAATSSRARQLGRCSRWRCASGWVGSRRSAPSAAPSAGGSITRAAGRHEHRPQPRPGRGAHPR